MGHGNFKIRTNRSIGKVFLSFGTPTLTTEHWAQPPCKGLNNQCFTAHSYNTRLSRSLLTLRKREFVRFVSKRFSTKEAPPSPPRETPSERRRATTDAAANLESAANAANAEESEIVGAAAATGVDRRQRVSGRQNYNYGNDEGNDAD